MDLGNGLGHLTYSTLVHPADDWPQLWDSLQRYLPQVKQRISPNAAVRRLHPVVAPDGRDAVHAEGRTRHAQSVSEGPGPLRLYRQRVCLRGLQEHADQRAGLRTGLAHARTPRVHQTGGRHSGGHLSGVGHALDSDRAARLQAPRHRARRRRHLYRECPAGRARTSCTWSRRPGTLLTLGLEPEPRCYLETTDETITYFQDYLYTSAAARRLAQLARIPLDTAIAALRRHLGVVFDIGHQAVGFEDIPASLQKLVDAGIPIVKLQEAASMYIGEVTDEKIAALQRFATTIYLSQTVECRGDHLEHYLNLEDAMAGWQTDKTPRQWRTHFHVPVFLEAFGPLHSTQFALAQALALHKQTPLSRHLEIETYTWDVLPDQYKTGDIVDYVCRELEWVKGQLA